MHRLLMRSCCCYVNSQKTGLDELNEKNKSRASFPVAYFEVVLDLIDTELDVVTVQAPSDRNSIDNEDRSTARSNNPGCSSCLPNCAKNETKTIDWVYEIFKCRKGNGNTDNLYKPIRELGGLP